MKYIILKSFQSLQAGINYMTSYEYPSAFVVSSDTDKWYDKNGVEISQTHENYSYTKIIMRPDTYVYCITNVNDFVHREFCYDGNFMFFTKED
jgi:hypothetical protein